jgi:branched-subunit amino acid transport protein
MMRDVWIATAALTVICFTIKAVGPVALGGRELPGWALGLIALVPSALLPALIVVETFADGQQFVIDARAAGLAAATAALALRGSMLLVLLVAAVVTAGARALGAA